MAGWWAASLSNDRQYTYGSYIRPLAFGRTCSVNGSETQAQQSRDGRIQRSTGYHFMLF